MRYAARILGAFVICGLAGVAHSQNFPTKPIQLIVPFTPGGGMSDRVARLIADKFREKWGQPGVVDNRPGASANIGGEYVARAPADGYTLLVAGDNPLVINKALFPKLAYDPEAFTPVSIVVKSPLILAVHPAVPARNLEELLAYAKAKPDSLNLGSNGTGSNMHLSLELLKMETGVRITHVPYKGVPNALTDLVGGQIQMMFVGLGTVLQQMKAGKLRVIAVASEKRMAALPDVPAISEVVPGFVTETWFAVVAPAKTPPGIAARLSEVIAEMVRAPDTLRLLETLSVEGVGSTPEETAKFLKEETVRWSKVIRTTGVKAE